MANVSIYTSRTCGWAVRNYAALIEKGISFETIPSTDSAGEKLGEFLAHTPYGKTPVLVCGEIAVFESTLINEYIDERFPNPPLMPKNSGDRSEVRKWSHYCEQRLFPMLTAIAQAEDTQARRVVTTRFDEEISWFGQNVVGDKNRGPYLFGNQFSLLELCFSTLFCALESLSAPKIPVRHPALRSWADNILARPSIHRAQEIQRRLKF